MAKIKNITLASEHSLAKEWNTPEEDEAWKDAPNCLTDKEVAEILHTVKKMRKEKGFR